MNKEESTWGGVFTVEHVRKGEVIHTQTCHNLVTTEGMKSILDVILHGDAKVTSTWYVGLIGDNTTPVIADTYASPSFAEAAAYDETVRQTYNEAIASGTSTVTTTNSANKATFTMTGVTDTTIYGAFVGSDSTKDDTATSGAVLLAAKLFSVARPVLDDDQLLITYDFSLTNA